MMLKTSEMQFEIDGGCDLGYTLGVEQDRKDEAEEDSEGGAQKTEHNRHLRGKVT